MKTLQLFVVAAILMMIAGCGPAVVTPQKLATYQTDTAVNSLVYCGSDEQFHYFERWVNMQPVREFKVTRASLDWPNPVPREDVERKTPVFRGTIEDILKQSPAAETK